MTFPTLLEILEEPGWTDSSRRDGVAVHPWILLRRLVVEMSSNRGKSSGDR